MKPGMKMSLSGEYIYIVSYWDQHVAIFTIWFIWVQHHIFILLQNYLPYTLRVMQPFSCKFSKAKVDRLCIKHRSILANRARTFSLRRRCCHDVSIETKWLKDYFGILFSVGCYFLQGTSPPLFT